MVATRERRGRRWLIGLGGNLADPRRAIGRAIDTLVAHPAIDDVVCSSFWQSAPIEAGGPDFINAVAGLRSALNPFAMLKLAWQLETAEGRKRPYHHAPRTLDVDLLMADQLIIDSPALILPHPRMHQRAFVLAPLLELEPDCCIPGRGPARDWLARSADQRLRRLDPNAPGQAARSA